MRLTLLKAFVLLSLFLPSTATAVDYYVSTTGSDSSTGTSLINAFRTIQRAANRVAAGDTVYIRGGTYAEEITIATSGTYGNVITFVNYGSESPYCIGPNNDGISLTISGSYIKIDGFRFKRQYITAGGSNTYNVHVTGSNNEIDSCSFLGTDALTDRATGGREVGIQIRGGDYVYVHDCYSTELSLHFCAVGDNGSNAPRFFRIIDNTSINYLGNGAFIVSAQTGTMLNGLVEGNTFAGAYASDGIQMNNGDWSASHADPTTWGVILRNNLIYSHAENGIDLKSARYFVIENNVLWGSYGNNDGDTDGVSDLNGGTGGITHGTGTLAMDNIVRGNVIYDNHGGMLAYTGYRIYNNTILNNDRDYSGPNSTMSLGRYMHTGINAHWTANVKIINNLFGGNRYCALMIDTSRSNSYIDYNMYATDTSTPQMCSYVAGSYWGVQYSFTSWRSYVNSRPIGGNDAHSITGSPYFVSATSGAYGSSSLYDFGLTASSPAIDNGGPLTTAATSGSSSSTLRVADGAFFCDGYGITTGDTIYINGVSANISSRSGNYLYLDREISWNYGDGVYWCPSHQCPTGGQIDIGAYQYGAESDPEVPIDPDPDPSNTLSGGAPSGTLPSDTTMSNIYVTTSNSSTCYWSTSAGQAIGAMTQFTSTGLLSHSTTVYYLTPGAHTYYIKALDEYGSASDDYTVSFTVGDGASLINDNTYSADSANFHELYPASKLWDGNTGSGGQTGTNTADSVWIEFDLGALYDLTTASIYGDDDGNWQCITWTLQYKESSGDAWSTSFLEQDCNALDWHDETITGDTGRYVRVTINGTAYPAVQVQEMTLMGTLADAGGEEPETPASGERPSKFRVGRTGVKIIRSKSGVKSE